MYKRSGSSISDEQSVLGREASSSTSSSLAPHSHSQPREEIGSSSKQRSSSILIMTPAAGIYLLRKTKLPLFENRTFYKSLILFLTFIAYSAYHISRRPLSIVKSVLNKNCSSVTPPEWIHVTNETRATWCDWEPFAGAHGNSMLGIMDSSYLFSYAFFMFFSGFVAERMCIRYFLSLGMIISGFLTYLFGIAFYYDIHSFWFFFVVEVLSGLFQSTGWPAVVVAVARWFGPSSRGTIFGLWNAHTNLGNIVGAVVAGVFVEYNWGLSFIVPGAIISVSGFIIFLFLVPDPEEVGLAKPDDLERRAVVAKDTTNDPSFDPASSDLINRLKNPAQGIDSDESTPLMIHEPLPVQIKHESTEKTAVSFIEALRIPGVIEFSVSLFFSKLVSYMFLYWLPMYIKNNTDLSSESSAYMSVPFDVGGILGAIIAGYAADKTKSSALTCIVMLIVAIPSLFAYMELASYSLLVNILLQCFVGAVVNGPYCLITTAVSAELGNSMENSHAMATVTAIIDGTGSIGAAVGPLLVGLLSVYGWDIVFYIAMAADLISMCFLIRIGRNEYRKIRERRGASVSS